MKKLILVLTAAITLLVSSAFCAASSPRDLYEGTDPDGWYWLYSDAQESVYVATSCGLRFPDGDVSVWVKRSNITTGTVSYSSEYIHRTGDSFRVRCTRYVQFDDGTSKKTSECSGITTYTICSESVGGQIAAKIDAMY